MKTVSPQIVELNMDKLEELMQRAKAALSPEDYETIQAVIESYVYVTDLLEEKGTTIERLRKLLFGSSTEKTRDVVPPPAEAAAPDDTASTANAPAESTAPPSKAPGHGRHGANHYLGAERIPVPHATLQSGNVCPECKKGRVYEELIRQAAQGEVLHNDDTTMRILALTGKPASGQAPDDADPQRTGVFTSGIVSTNQGRRIALFFTGRQHAGENLADVLTRRAADLGPPIQMCDALSRNLPAEFKTILANCLAHGRRPFVEVAAHFPEACRHVLERLGAVYKNDALAREQNLSPQARLQFHQTESGPIMDALHAWLTRQFEDRLVEPNSGLGEAITYLLRHWEKLTLFLREPGAPLDNTLCERALKKVILHRKNALFYKTQNGARVGDLFMSLIYTCQLCDANPFDYLTALHQNAAALGSNPQTWMPWNYRDTLAQTAAPPHTLR